MSAETNFDAATRLMCAYLGNHTVAREDLSALATDILRVVKQLEDGPTQLEPQPAVPIDQSYTDEHIICLEDGVEVKLLSRYLKNHHGMTPEEYREKWNLPEDYPLVAASYSRERSSIAKSQGLGKTKPVSDGRKKSTRKPVPQS